MDFDYEPLTEARASLPGDLVLGEATRITAEQRKEWAEKGLALPDESWPIPDLKFLDKAIQNWGRAVAAGNAAQVKRWMLKRAKALGASEEKVQQIKDLSEALSEAEQSLDEQSRRVGQAWQDYHKAHAGPMQAETYSWPREVYADHVIVEMDGDTWSIPYSETDGEITFDADKATKVERAWVATEAEITDEGLLRVTEAFSGQDWMLAPIVEAKDTEPDGSKWEVVILRAGKSKNGRRYSEKVLKEAAPLFEGARVLARSDQDHIDGKEKSVRNIVGWIEGVTFKSKQLRGTLNISESAEWLRTMLVDAWKRGKRDLVGLSIRAHGTGQMIQEGFEQVLEVESITEVETVDVVFEPAAGGGLVKLVAAVGKEEAMPLEELTIEQLKETRPDLVEELLKGSAPAPEGGERTPGEGGEPEPQQDPASAATGGAEPAREPAMAGAGTGTQPVAAAEAVTDPEDHVPSAIGRFVIREALDETKLPAISRKRIAKRFAGKAFREAELTEAIQDEIELFTALEKDGLVTSGGERREVQVTMEEATKVKAAMDGFFLGEDVEVEGEKVPRFRSFKEAYVKVTGDKGITGRLPQIPKGALGLSEANGGRTKISRLVYDAETQTFVEAILSSTFAEILGDSITRRMLREYAELGLNIYEPLVETVPAGDFRTQRRMRLGGYANLPAVNQDAAYAALTSPADEEATYAVTKRGGLERITLEAIANDDVGALRRIPQRLARAAAHTLQEFVLEFLAANPVIYDTLALFVAGHNNLGTTALSAASLKAARARLRKQTDMSSSKRLGLAARYLWVPVDLEDVAFEILEADGKPGSADNDANFLRGKFQTVVVDYWTDANNWFLTASKDQVPLIELAFFGSEEPELFTQDLGNVGEMFTNDRIVYKIRHIYGGAVMDYRGFDGSIVA